MAYKQYEEAYERARVNARSAAVSEGLNKALSSFRTVRDARVKHGQDEELFQLKKKQLNLELKAAENDPNLDPGVVIQARKDAKLKLGMEENELKAKGKVFQYGEYDLSKKTKQLAQKAQELDMARAIESQYPGSVARTQIDPTTGELVKAEKKSKKDKRYDLKDLKEYYDDLYMLDAKEGSPEDIDRKKEMARILEKRKAFISDDDEGGYVGRGESDTGGDQFDEETEAIISANMEKHGVSRQEVVKRLKEKRGR